MICLCEVRYFTDVVTIKLVTRFEIATVGIAGADEEEDIL